MTRAYPSAAARRGDRVCGWLEQTRSEVLACDGVVATSQPLAVQALVLTESLCSGAA